jgi:hypothetical protein
MRSNLLFRRAPPAALALFTLCLAQRAQAFGPGRGIPTRDLENRDNFYGVGQLFGTSHADMTRDVVDMVLSTELGITQRTAQMDLAIEQITRGNMGVDDNQAWGHLHADGETFARSHRRIWELRNHVLEALAKQDYTAARKRLGEALHTLQDFYSHSNWIESGKTTPHPTFGSTVEVLTKEGMAGANEPTCEPCGASDCTDNLLTQKLTSGYYQGEPTTMTATGAERDAPFAAVKDKRKCHHGGMTDKAAPLTTGMNPFREGINKDSSNYVFSPHYELHADAVAVAKAASYQFLLSIRNKVSALVFRDLFSSPTSFGLVLNLSNSMDDVATAIQDYAENALTERLKVEVSHRLVFVGFSDPQIGPTYSGTDVGDWHDFVKEGRWSTTDGDDCPELSLDATKRAVDMSDNGGNLFLITDADPKNADLSSTIINLATRKHLRIHVVLLSPSPDSACTRQDATTYERIAHRTGGSLILLARSSIGELDDHFQQLGAPVGQLIIDNQGASGFQRRLDKAGGGAVPLSVDDTMTSFTVLARGAGELDLLRPSGASVLASEPNVSKSMLDGQVLYTVDAPEPGNWSVRGTYESLRVSSESALQLTNIDFVELRGREGHQGFFPVHGVPVIGRSYPVTVDLTQAVGEARLELRSLRGDVLASAALQARPGPDGQPQEDGRYAGTLIVPSEPYVAYVLGRTRAGQAFVRTPLQVVNGQHLTVTAPPQQELVPGGEATYTFRLTNEGPSDTFALKVTDSSGLLVEGSSQSVTLEHGASRDVTVKAWAAPSFKVGTRGTIELEATSDSDASRTTFASVDLEISENVDRDGDGVIDADDNCVEEPNPQQLDWDRDGEGNECDASPGSEPPQTGCRTAVGDQGGWVTSLLLWLALGIASRRRRSFGEVCSRAEKARASTTRS